MNFESASDLAAHERLLCTVHHESIWWNLPSNTRYHMLWPYMHGMDAADVGMDDDDAFTMHRQEEQKNKALACVITIASEKQQHVYGYPEFICLKDHRIIVTRRVE